MQAFFIGKDFAFLSLRSMIPARNSLAFWHLLAIITITFWGTSFVSTKVLLNHGFSAVQIFSLRFAITYLILLAASHKQFRSKNWKHELILFISGITGCTLYFWTENTALSFSPSSNVALIICANPLLILILGGIIYKSERLGKRQILGCLVTFVGMVLVVLNGKFVLKLSPVGDLLACSAGVMWAIYSLVVKQLNGKYNSLFITRCLFPPCLSKREAMCRKCLIFRGRTLWNPSSLLTFCALQYVAPCSDILFGTMC